jgi:hypothetical protein
MFNTIAPLATKEEFFFLLFSDPNNKLVLTSEFIHSVTHEEFFVECYNRLGFIKLPIKKFTKHKSIEDELRYNYKNLRPQEKYDRDLRPQMNNLYYDAKENCIVGTDAYIIFIDRSIPRIKYLGDESLFINMDKLNNITMIEESKYTNGRYPAYKEVFPEFKEEDEVFHLGEFHFNVIFHFAKLCKVLKIPIPYITIGPACFNVHLLCRFIEIIKRNRPEYFIKLHISGPNRAAYFVHSSGDTKGLIMPIIKDENSNLFFKLI